MSKLAVDEALNILEILGSQYDTVYIKSECPTCGTCVDDRKMEVAHLDGILDFDIEDTIKYYNIHNDLVEGDLCDMIVDRLGYEVS